MTPAIIASHKLTNTQIRLDAVLLSDLWRGSTWL